MVIVVNGVGVQSFSGNRVPIGRDGGEHGGVTVVDGGQIGRGHCTLVRRGDGRGVIIVNGDWADIVLRSGGVSVVVPRRASRELAEGDDLLLGRNTVTLRSFAPAST